MTVLQIKYSTTSGHTPSSLADGQLAINIIDGILFWTNGTAIQSFNFTTPTVPTAGGSDSSTKAANTAFVQGAIAALSGAPPATLATLALLAAAINNDPNFSKTINNIIVGCVRFDIPQTLNYTQQTQALLNLGFAGSTIDGGVF